MMFSVMVSELPECQWRSQLKTDYLVVRVRSYTTPRTLRNWCDKKIAWNPRLILISYRLLRSGSRSTRDLHPLYAEDSTGFTLIIIIEALAALLAQPPGIYHPF